MIPSRRSSDESTLHDGVGKNPASYALHHKENASDPEKGGSRAHEETRSIANGKVQAEQKLAHPLAGWTDEQLRLDAHRFAQEHDLSDLIGPLEKGAILAGDAFAFDTHPLFNEDERTILREEYTNVWKQPKALIGIVLACSMAAIVQGQDQSVINGANIFFPIQFGIDGADRQSTLILGLVNAAPYFVCAVCACWVTDPLNKLFGRKGTILFSLVFATFPCIWAAVSPSWQVLFASRCVLAFGIGPKSATVPVYAAEAAPPAIRGRLVMQWQMWTAFGIALGYVCSLAFYHVSSSTIEGLNWRLMLGSAAVPPIIVFVQVIFCPESPRWLLEKGRYRDAYNSLSRLRFTSVQAARDLYYIDKLLQAEKQVVRNKHRYAELFTVPRVRRATIASAIVCGVNVIAYYSSRVLVESGLSELSALLGSFGFGLINWLFAIPGIFLIDSFGRRNLLLTTYPMMAVCLLITGFSFWIPFGSARTAVILLGIYLFGIAYSPGCGPVPFTYSSEAFPLAHRSIGMAWATAITWLFNGVLAFTFPIQLASLKPQGAFGFYAGMNIVGVFLVLCFVPETKSLSLEELDYAFGVSTRHQASHGLRQIPYFVNKKILRRDVQPEILYELPPSIQKTYAPAAGGH